ncbi:alkene reductase [Sphaerisporangium krabiense]|uniref:N-ethylmaleimide reductase n=1 Tax=Sphaerisporangium krabiense TaxID=763782 RepID=A0A7W8Z8T6_9ACTN|nr:alkene reductase [Sphaerisporangium krabiense]MBB5629581.1 N-ethylmaleimide reductase [Sphaerisporangium krabiense]GII67239.1 alkene reductase [Sphaerisporangium krabiense]
MPDLFEPVRLGRLRLPNRLVMSPMTRSRADERGVPHPEAALYYAQRATAGLIIAEGTQPSLAGQGHPGTPGLHTPEQARAWRAVTGAVHAAGGRVFVQLMHAGRIGHPCVNGLWPVAPSPVRAAGRLFTHTGMRELPVPRELSASEIRATLSDFAGAARLAVEAGFDGVELHGGNGYLVHQFLAARTNRRRDAYGRDRGRFAADLVAVVAEAVGADRVGLRITPGDRCNDMAEEDAEDFYPDLVARLAPIGLLYLHIAGVAAGSAAAGRLRACWPGALVAAPGSGGTPRPDGGRADGERWLAAGADLVAYGRGFLANPDFVERLRTGAPLNSADPATYYGGGARGYTDYSRAPSPT